MLAGFGRLMTAESEPLRAYGVTALARVCFGKTQMYIYTYTQPRANHCWLQALVAYGCVQNVCHPLMDQPPAGEAHVDMLEQVELQRYMRFASAAYGALGRVWRQG